MTTRRDKRASTQRAGRSRPSAYGRKRGRPRQESSGAREHILTAAQALFASQGFDATTTKEIADRAGVPAGLVFYYFSSKGELLNALVWERSALEFVKADVNARMVAPSTQTAHDALTTFGVQFLAALRERKEMVRILFREANTNESAADQFRQLRDQAAQIVAAFMKRLLDATAQCAFPVDVAARMFISDLVLANTSSGSIDPKPFVAGAVRVLLDGRVSRS